MSAEPWESFFEVGQWPAQLAAADGATVFVPTARVVADGIKHQAEEAPPSHEPASPPQPEPEAPGAPEERKSIFD